MLNTQMTASKLAAELASEAMGAAVSARDAVRNRARRGAMPGTRSTKVEPDLGRYRVRNGKLRAAEVTRGKESRTLADSAEYETLRGLDPETADLVAKMAERQGLHKTAARVRMASSRRGSAVKGWYVPEMPTMADMGPDIEVALATDESPAAFMPDFIHSDRIQSHPYGAVFDAHLHDGGIIRRMADVDPTDAFVREAFDVANDGRADGVEIALQQAMAARENRAMTYRNAMVDTMNRRRAALAGLMRYARGPAIGRGFGLFGRRLNRGVAAQQLLAYTLLSREMRYMSPLRHILDRPLERALDKPMQNPRWNYTTSPRRRRTMGLFFGG